MKIIQLGATGLSAPTARWLHPTGVKTWEGAPGSTLIPYAGTSPRLTHLQESPSSPPSDENIEKSQGKSAGLAPASLRLAPATGRLLTQQPRCQDSLAAPQTRGPGAGVLFPLREPRVRCPARWHCVNCSRDLTSPPYSFHGAAMNKLPVFCKVTNCCFTWAENTRGNPTSTGKCWNLRHLQSCMLLLKKLTLLRPALIYLLDTQAMQIKCNRQFKEMLQKFIGTSFLKN